jgi:hypothetical protein
MKMNVNFKECLLIVTIVLILWIFSLFECYKLSRGGVKIEDLTIQPIIQEPLKTKPTNPDIHFKVLLSNLLESTGQRITEKIDFDFPDLEQEARKIFKLPTAYEPDFVYIDNVTNKCLIIEMDEGGNFHSDLNINYIYKWLNYNRLLENGTIKIKGTDYQLSILRVTYPNALKTGNSSKIDITNDNTGELDDFTIKLVKFSLLVTTGFGCYILGRYQRRGSVKSYKVYPHGKIKAKINKSTMTLFDDLTVPFGNLSALNGGRGENEINEEMTICRLNSDIYNVIFENNYKTSVGFYGDYFIDDVIWHVKDVIDWYKKELCEHEIEKRMLAFSVVPERPHGEFKPFDLVEDYEAKLKKYGLYPPEDTNVWRAEIAKHPSLSGWSSGLPKPVYSECPVIDFDFVALAEHYDREISKFI